MNQPTTRVYLAATDAKLPRVRFELMIELDSSICSSDLGEWVEKRLSNDFLCVSQARSGRVG